jgi:hypothetical protein
MRNDQRQCFSAPQTGSLLSPPLRLYLGDQYSFKIQFNIYVMITLEEKHKDVV